VGVGVWTDVPAACAAAVKLTGSTRPDPAQVEAYRKAYPRYRELYPALKPEFDKM
jgi:xylulokinase